MVNMLKKLRIQWEAKPKHTYKNLHLLAQDVIHCKYLRAIVAILEVIGE